MFSTQGRECPLLYTEDDILHLCTEEKVCQYSTSIVSSTWVVEPSTTMITLGLEIVAKKCHTSWWWMLFLISRPEFTMKHVRLRHGKQARTQENCTYNTLSDPNSRNVPYICTGRNCWKEEGTKVGHLISCMISLRC